MCRNRDALRDAMTAARKSGERDAAAMRARITRAAERMLSDDMPHGWREQQRDTDDAS